MQNRKISRH